ncbi:hypothetical protein K438DRAFT_1966764 [Mycena galopus ATCC 62051]|nr:hypothetical protein K438DRAFT_1966764 [Mycena galopus ATCC 62051]
MSFNANIVLGALLAATWANSILYPVEIIQAVYYYRHFKHDNGMLKFLVSSAIVIDFVAMIANYSSVYLYTVTHRRDSAYLQNQYWASQFLTALAQGFLAARYWRLTRNKFITLTLFFFITVTLGGAFSSGAAIALFPEYVNRNKIIIPVTTWLVTEAVTDISIAAALLWELMKVRASLKATKSLVNRLVAQTIQSGSAGAIIALAASIAFLINKESNVPTGIAYTLGRIYCITMLANLNSRKTGKTWSGQGTPTIITLDIREERGNQEQSEGDGEYGGIHVHRSAMPEFAVSSKASVWYCALLTSITATLMRK